MSGELALDVPAPLRRRFRDRFGPAPALPSVFDAVFEGTLGRLRVDRLPEPRVLRADLGCYAFLAGDADRASASGLVLELSEAIEVVEPTEAWRRRITGLRECVERPMRSFASETLEPSRLRDLLPDPGTGIEVRALEREDVDSLDADLRPHALQVFPGREDFVARGFGFGAFVDGSLAAVATSYSLAPSGVEIAISTRPPMRRRGLAAAAAAAMILRCLEWGLRPWWHAANPISQRLASRLGFRVDGHVEILQVFGRIT